MSEFQPDLKVGGRANTIAVNPTDDADIIVAATTGGLFRSGDGGHTWHHLDSLHCYGTNAVAFLPEDPRVLFAATQRDFQVPNGGGIWRSSDGGTTWAQVPSPTAPPGVTMPLSAFDISIAPAAGYIYVATEWGISRSLDRGATWTHASLGVTRSVLALGDGIVLVAGSWGVRRSVDDGATWSTADAGQGGIWDTHALAGSPFSRRQAYLVSNARKLYYTEDAGVTWNNIPSAPTSSSASCGGIAFVKAVGRRLTHPASSRYIDLYFGNRCSLARLHCPGRPGTDGFRYDGAWADVAVDHADPRHMALGRSSRGRERPLLLASDGGLHQSSDGGAHWTLTGGGRAGYNALQITEVGGQWITDIGRHDTYFGTQDNQLWASGDDGATWTAAGNEGFYIEAERRVPTSSDSTITFGRPCGDGDSRVSGPLFANPRDWPDPDQNCAFPKFLRGAATFSDTLGTQYVEHVEDTPAFARGLAYTRDLGTHWGQYAAFPEDPRDLPKTGPPEDRPVLYQAIRVPAAPEMTQLVRILQPLSSGPVVQYPFMRNFGSIGTTPTEFAFYKVFAVDPARKDHLIAADVANQRVVESWTFGDSWVDLPQLTSLVTGGGAYSFRRVDDGGSPIFSLASAISFCPDASQLILVGRSEGGVFFSEDHGTTWSQIKSSERMTRITSFHWRTSQDVVVSTYGRGLWRLRRAIVFPLQQFQALCSQCTVSPISPSAPGSDRMTRVERAVLVFGGRLMGGRAVRGRLRDVWVSPGSSVAFFPESTDIAVGESIKWRGFSGEKQVRDPMGTGIRGLTLSSDSHILGVALADAALSLERPADRPVAEITSGRESPAEGHPYLSLIAEPPSGYRPGEAMKIAGRAFPAGASIVISLDHERWIEAAADDRGSFTAVVKAPEAIGEHHLAAAHQGRLLDAVVLRIGPADEERGEAHH